MWKREQAIQGRNRVGERQQPALRSFGSLAPPCEPTGRRHPRVSSAHDVGRAPARERPAHRLGDGGHRVRERNGCNPVPQWRMVALTRAIVRDIRVPTHTDRDRPGRTARVRVAGRCLCLSLCLCSVFSQPVSSPTRPVQPAAWWCGGVYFHVSTVGSNEKRPPPFLPHNN